MIFSNYETKWLNLNSKLIMNEHKVGLGYGNEQKWNYNKRDYRGTKIIVKYISMNAFLFLLMACTT